MKYTLEIPFLKQEKKRKIESNGMDFNIKEIKGTLNRIFQRVII